VLPSDVIAAAEPAADTPHEVVAVDAILADRMGLDIGPESARLFAASIVEANTISGVAPLADSSRRRMPMAPCPAWPR
jgi:phosphoglycerate kinase